jgi:uncharacterized protein Usg
LDWLPPVERARKQQFEDGDDEADPGDREGLMVQSIYSQYSALLKRDGYCALTELLGKLKTRREAEVRNDRALQYRLNELKLLLNFFEPQIHERSEDTPIQEIISSGADFNRELPSYHTVTWTGPGGPPNDQDSGSEDYQGVISPDVKGYDVPEYTPPSVEFSRSTTLGEIARDIDDECTRCESGMRGAQRLRRLIRFRIKLLQRFIWTYEIAGAVPDDPTVQKIPEFVQRNPKGLAHALRVLELIDSLQENGKLSGGEWPSQPELKEKAREYSFGDGVSATPDSIVTRATDFLREVFPLRYEKFGDDFYVLLLEYDEDFREWAAESDDVDL